MPMRILPLLLIVVLPFFLHAQSFNSGLFLGVNATQISGDNLSGFDKAGIYGGLFVNRYFNEKLGMQMELDFSQKGSRKNPVPEKDDFESYILRINYIEIPVMVRYEYSRHFCFEAGLAFGVLVSYSEDVDQGSPYLPSQDFEQSEFSIIGGIYYQLMRDTRISLRYSNSLLPVRKHASGQEYRLNRGQYNSVLSVSFHRQINFFKR